MWKWILGVLGVIVLCLAGMCYAGYKKLTSGGDTVAVTIGGGSERVFRLLTTPDSMVAWMTPGTEIVPLGKGAFRPGDTLRVSSPLGTRESGRRQTELWVVRQVQAPTILTVDAITFDPAGTPHVAHTRRDSLVTVGDSTKVVSTFEMAPIYAGGQPLPDSGGAKGAMLSVAEKMLLGASKLVAETQMKQLKAYVEGKAVEAR